MARKPQQPSATAVCWGCHRRDLLAAQVTEEGAPGRSFSGTSPTSPWTEVCLSQRTGQRISGTWQWHMPAKTSCFAPAVDTHQSGTPAGPLFFGYSDVITMRAISALYNPTELAAALQASFKPLVVHGLVAVTCSSLKPHASLFAGPTGGEQCVDGSREGCAGVSDH